MAGGDRGLSPDTATVHGFTPREAIPNGEGCDPACSWAYPAVRPAGLRQELVPPPSP